MRATSSRGTVRFLLAATVTLAAATAAVAGVTQTSHRFERIGFGGSGVAATLPFPNLGRMLVLEHDGQVKLTSGDGLVSEPVMTLPVSQLCAIDGIQAATWDPQAPGQRLFVSYVQQTPRRFVVARITFTGRTPSAPEIVFQTGVPATACSNIGGGIAIGRDGMLYVGIGDLTNAAGAQNPGVLQGKILRLIAAPPGGVPADNPQPGSPVYATGVRNPTRIVASPTTDDIFFVDAGPSTGTPIGDELNLLEPLGNYAWNRIIGNYETMGFVDPLFTWTTPIDPSGLAIYTHENLGRPYQGKLLVSGWSGRISRMDVNLAVDPPVATELILYNPTGADPIGFTDMTIRRDGYVHVTTETGETFRLRSEAALVDEPSDFESITPLLVRKVAGGQLEVSVERETAVEDYGVYIGDIPGLERSSPPPNTYTHPLTTTDLHPVDANISSAWSRFNLDSASLGAVTYILASAVNQRQETGLGVDSDFVQRPGGAQTFGCPCPASATGGVLPDDCATPWTLMTGLAGAGNRIGPVSFPDDFDCNVILLDISMEWCGPCRLSAMTAEAKYQRYRDRGFTLIHVISQDISRAPSTIDTITRWQRDFGLTFPVMMDENERTWNTYDTTGFIPQYWVVSREGVITDHFIGAGQEAAIDAAIERELDR